MGASRQSETGTRAPARIPARRSEGDVPPAAPRALARSSARRPARGLPPVVPGVGRGAARMGVAGVASLLAALLAAPFATPLAAGEADVIEGTVTALGDGRYRIDATVRHADTGWDHYANRWEVLAPDGTVLGVRELLHPHVDEQPFTRSLTLEIPADVARVTLRAGDSVHETGGASVELEVPR